MVRVGVKPKGKVTIKWSAIFAYAIGLIVSDGNLSSDGRHLNLTSKDREVIETFRKCLNIKNKIGRKARSGKIEKKYYVLQFGDVIFYRFLLGIGLTPAKSKTIGKIEIPQRYFFDFLRGSFDGDGCFYSYWDPRWKSSHMFYLAFSSASKIHTEWIRREIGKFLFVRGHVSKSKRKGSIYNLRYAKKESLEIIKKMYYNPKVTCLSRKRAKIKKALLIESAQQKTYFK